MIKFDVVRNPRIWGNYVLKGVNDSAPTLGDIGTHLRINYEAEFDHRAGTITFPTEKSLSMFLLRWS